MTKSSDFAVFADVFAALAHPSRLEIVHILSEGEHTASQLVERTGLSKVNVSQHVNLLKVRGLVHCEKRGAFCHYRLTGPHVLKTCAIVRQFVLDEMPLTTARRREVVRAGTQRKPRLL